MKFSVINDSIKHLFGVGEKNAKMLYDLIIEKQLYNILELGFAHGKSTCYMAAALDELKKGNITTIDIKIVMQNDPNIINLSKSLGLDKYISPIFSDISSNWELRKIIQQQSINNLCVPKYDFCFIDAFHSWEMAGFDFFLVDKLLVPGGWIIFDDLHWSFNASPSWSNSEKTKKMTPEYKETKQILDVYTYLVQQHPNYDNFRIDGNFGFAQKIIS